MIFSSQIWFRHRFAFLIPFLILTSCVQADRERSEVNLTQSHLEEQEGNFLDSYIAFVSDRRISHNNDIWLIRPDASELTPVTSDDMQDSMPVWSPNGEKLAFISTRTDNSTIIRIYDLAESTIIKEVLAPNIVRLTWGLQGKLVYVRLNPSTGRLSTLVAGIENEDQPVELPGEQAYIDPQGQLVAYIVSSQLDQRTGSIQLGVETFNGTHIPIEYLENERLGVVGVAWNLDGTFFAVSYGVLARAGNPGLSIFSVADDQITEVAAVQSFDNKWGGVPLYCPPHWSPTEDLLAYTIGNQGTEVTCSGPLVISSSTLSNTTVVDEIDAVLGSNPWSPNGHQLVFAHFPGVPLMWLEQGHEGELRSKYKSSIWLVGNDGAHLQLLIDSDGYNGEPAWQPKPAP